MRPSLAVMAIALLWRTMVPASAAPADDAEATRQIMVVQPNAPLKLEEQVIGLADVGHIYTIGRAQGAWLWVPARGAWIRERDVVPVDEAIVHFTRQLQEQPNPRAWHHRGRAHDALGHFEDAIDDLTEAIRRGPDARIHNDRGNVWFKTGDMEQALADYTAAIELDPEYAVAYNNRSTVLSRQGKFGEALRDLDAALRLDPQYAEAWNNRGAIHTDRGDHKQAIADFTEAIRLAPDYAVAYGNRGHARAAAGDFAGTLQDYEQALEIDPQLVNVRNDLAWLLATCPQEKFRDGKRAVEEATLAIELAGEDDWNHLDTLAAAQAENNKFEAAVETVERALELAPETEAEPLRERLKLYRDERPFRQE